MEFVGQLLVNGSVIGVTYVVFALGLTLIFGILGLINFAHGEFYMLGAYGSFVLQQQFGLGYITSAITTIIFVLILAFIIEKYTISPLIDTDHLNSLLATFAISIIILNIIVIAYGNTPRQIETPFTGVLAIGDVYITYQRLILIVVGVVIILLLNLFIKRSKLGKLMRAVSQNRMGAMVTGIPIKRIYTATFVLGIGLATISGILIGPITYATPTMGSSAILKGFVVVILGGLGSIPGAIIGGFLLGFGETVASVILGNSWKDVVSYLILIIVLLIKPEGIFGYKRRAQ